MRLIWKTAIALLIIAAVTETTMISAVDICSTCTIQCYGTIYYTRQTFDFNHDGKVDIVDAALTARAFGSFVGHERWDPIMDLNGDGKVGEADLSMIGCWDG